MQLPPVSRHVASFHLDTNRINVHQRLPEINQLEEWHRRDVVSLELSFVARSEVLKTRHPLFERKAYRYLATETLADTPEERGLLGRIAGILFPARSPRGFPRFHRDGAAAPAAGEGATGGGRRAW